MSYSKGLEGVIADESAISNVEGDIPRLSYRGYAIEELVEEDYATVMWLVLFGELPTAAEKSDLVAFLATHGALTGQEVSMLQAMPTTLHPMRVLQSIIPLLETDREVAFRDMSEDAALGLQIIARMPAVIASYRCLSTDGAIPAFDADKEYLANFLTMFTGKEPHAEHVDIFRIVQILQMEHSFNAGTFTARVAASTLAPVHAVLSAAVGALSGILHGGADEAALTDAQRVGNPNAAPGYVRDLLARKGKLMGMGHREYRKVDPRSVILKPLAESMCQGTPYENDFDTLVALETAFNAEMQKKGKEVWANLEFYKGPVFETLGLPPNYFTAVFAMSRSIGWLAHLLESRADNRIIRPKAAYIGPAHRTIAA